jgi:uncharacterized membrane protein YphA (DoxX/SURF4 family)
MTMSRTTIVLWALRLLAAAIMLQTLYFKFSAAEESVYIFSQLGMEPWGRIGTGMLELVASLLILYPRTTSFGALLGAGLMSGAIFLHLTKLGISVRGDGGQLFVYAVVVLLSCCLLLFFFRNDLILFFRKSIIK